MDNQRFRTARGVTFRERFWGPPGKISRKRRMLLLIAFPLIMIGSGSQGFLALNDGRTWSAVFNLTCAVILGLLWMMLYLYPKYSARNTPTDKSTAAHE